MQPAITSLVEFRLVTAGASTLTLVGVLIQESGAGNSETDCRGQPEGQRSASIKDSVNLVALLARHRL